MVHRLLHCADSVFLIPREAMTQLSRALRGGMLQVDQSNRGYYPFGMGSAKNPFAQEDRKEAFNAYGATPVLAWLSCFPSGQLCVYIYMAEACHLFWHQNAFIRAVKGPMTNLDSLAGFETVPGDATPFHGVNKWPSDQDLPGFREVMEEYHREMHLVAKRFVPLHPFCLAALQDRL